MNRVGAGWSRWATALLWLAVPAWGAEPQQQLNVVDKAVEAHGGKLFEASETTLEMCSKSGCFDVRSRVDGGRFEHEVTGRVSDGVRRVVSTNDRVDVFLDGKPVEVAEGKAQAYRDWAMARVYFCFLPYRLNDPGVRKQDLGVEEWDGRSLRRVRVTFPAGSSTDADDVYVYWFDETSGRLALFAYSYSGDPGGLRFRRLKNYRRVGGLLFYDQENLGTEDPDVDVDALSPSTVKTLRAISEVELRNIEVRTLSGAAVKEPSR